MHTIPDRTCSQGGFKNPRKSGMSDYETTPNMMSPDRCVEIDLVSPNNLINRKKMNTDSLSPGLKK